MQQTDQQLAAGNVDAALALLESNNKGELQSWASNWAARCQASRRGRLAGFYCTSRISTSGKSIAAASSCKKALNRRNRSPPGRVRGHTR